MGGHNHDSMAGHPKLTGRLRNLMVDSPESFGARARARRWETLLRAFPAISRMEVVDLGGTVEWWQRAPVRPARVTVVNLLEPGTSDDPTLVPVLGDACRAREVLAAAGEPNKYDLVVSNSLVEHVGGHAQRAMLAREILGLAPRHWVQTPYRYFPVEPHWLFPFMQFLPLATRTWISQRWPLAHSRPADRDTALSEVMWTELIGITEMASSYPRSTIVHERVLGLTKSITAVQLG